MLPKDKFVCEFDPVFILIVELYFHRILLFCRFDFGRCCYSWWELLPFIRCIYLPDTVLTRCFCKHYLYFSSRHHPHLKMRRLRFDKVKIRPWLKHLVVTSLPLQISFRSPALCLLLCCLLFQEGCFLQASFPCLYWLWTFPFWIVRSNWLDICQWQTILSLLSYPFPFSSGIASNNLIS